MTEAPRGPTSDSSPRETVESFLAALKASDVERAGDLLSEDVAYTNVSLPTVHGSASVQRLARAFFDRAGGGFDFYLHRIVAQRSTVLTERTDVLILGPVRMQSWVCGVFEVRDGRMRPLARLLRLGRHHRGVGPRAGRRGPPERAGAAAGAQTAGGVGAQLSHPAGHGGQDDAQDRGHAH